MHDAGVPVLGICYGAQELCTLFGGKVLAAGYKEVGWLTIETARPDLIPHGPWLLFHGDRCEPPPHATVLASNETGVQAFAIGRHLGVQFHPEVVHTPHGKQILENFLYRICGCRGDWTPGNFVADIALTIADPRIRLS